MNKYVPLGELIKTVSVTHKFDKPELIFLNTSDVLEGKILIDSYMPVNQMKGQAKKTIKNGDILYSEIRPRNRRYAYVNGLKNPEDYVVSTKLMVLRKTNEKLNNDYLYHFLTNNQTINYLQGRAENRICSFPQITFDIVKSLNIWLPELLMQSKIAKVLSDLDKKIELNNKINTELEAMTKLIYNYWFVQFDFPDANGNPYKSSGGKMVFNEELKRKVPEDWEIKELSNISDITTGKLDSNAEVIGGEYPFYTCAKDPSTINSYKYDGDVILIAGNNAAGNFHVNRYSGKFDAYQRTYIITAKERKHLNYLYQVLSRQMKIYKNRGKGSQTKFLTIGMLTEIQVFQPNTNVMSDYHKLTIPLYEKQMNIIHENKKLESLRDWLLPMLMNGQVTVKD
ncbi:MAG: type I restriction enzyme S subunit [Sulfurimonas sp.]|jgi:type I restriction enzyme S subunit